MSRTHLYPIAQALLAAALFGTSAPLSKLLLGEVQPIPLAALLYLGSGFGMLMYRAVRRGGVQAGEAEASVSGTDVPWLAGAVLTGGVAAPIVLLFSLRTTPAATASLLLNFEGVATTLIAVLAFKESSSRRVWGAIACVTLASILLSWQANAEWGISLGALGIVAACVLWGLDNNFTRNVSAKDPTVIVMIKGLAAGAFSLVLTALLGQPLPGIGVVLGSLLLGAVSYGLSIMLFVHAMRGLGSARTSALFGAAPFVGAALSFLLFRESLGLLALIAAPLMAIGALLLVGEDHSHSHWHAASEHEHRHVHDEHHNHTHQGGEAVPAGPHSHLHQHTPLRHTHPHAPDIHHRHGHSETAERTD
jgi:drug/metabolite transporter (DMT)-like permease